MTAATGPLTSCRVPGRTLHRMAHGRNLLTWLGALSLVVCAATFAAEPRGTDRPSGSGKSGAADKADKGKSTSGKSTGKKPSKSGGASAKAADGSPRDYTSRNFLVHTDLPAAEAEDLLKRLETMLRLISQYWNKPNRKTIEMYVIQDLAGWPVDRLDPIGVDKIRSREGITLSVTQSIGGQAVDADSIVYAYADRGIPLHEAVHAYCALNFGRTGPTWYAEGMAEMGHYWRDKDPGVHCLPEVVEYLKSLPPKPLTEITRAGDVTGDSWENYNWRWALCHLLANNPNYSPRFQPLGLRLLNDQPASFEEVYGPMASEITFEYEFFLKHFNIGYRADLCAWDWKTKAIPLKASGAVQQKIDAKRGWQSTRLTVKSGETYSFTAAGEWKLAASGESLSADGRDDGAGRLVGVIFKDFQLGEPFELGTAGEFTATDDGVLFARCRSDWCELADNSGSVTLKIRLAGK